jgi:hypothetical protein
MPIPEAPKLAKWPFLLGDAILLAAAGGMAWQVRHWTISEFAVLGGLVALGAVVSVMPFLREHNAAVKLWEQTNLAEAAQQLDQLVTISNQISAATTHWQSVQETAAKTAGIADESGRRIAAEAKGLTEFFQRADAQEKAATRLEVEKLRRNEAEFLQVLVHLLDHVYALFQASVRSGQTQLTHQLGQFRSACLDTVRRLGVVPHEARPGEIFDPRAHQTPDGQEPPAGSVVAATIACGYTFQGQPVRRILVALAKESLGEPAAAIAEPATPSADPEDAIPTDSEPVEAEVPADSVQPS